MKRKLLTKVLLAAFAISALTLFIGCTSSGDDSEEVVLNSETLHLGNNEDQVPLYGLEFTAVADISPVPSKTVLKVKFMGEQANWGGDPNTTISGLDFIPELGAEIYVNGTHVGPDVLDIPDNAACTEDFEIWSTYNCAFTFTRDVTDLIVDGENTVTVEAVNGDDWAVGKIWLVLD